MGGLQGGCALPSTLLGQKMSCKTQKRVFLSCAIPRSSWSSQIGGFAKSRQAAPCLLVRLCPSQTLACFQQIDGQISDYSGAFPLHFSIDQTLKDPFACLFHGGTEGGRTEPLLEALKPPLLCRSFASPCPQDVTRASSMKLAQFKVYTNHLVTSSFPWLWQGFICFSALFSEVVSQHPAAP